MTVFVKAGELSYSEASSRRWAASGPTSALAGSSTGSSASSCSPRPSDPSSCGLRLPSRIFFYEIPGGIFGDKLVSSTTGAFRGAPHGSSSHRRPDPHHSRPPARIPSTVFSQIVINMTAATALIPPLFIYLAYFFFRKNYDDVPRGFKIGSRRFRNGDGGLLILVFSFVFITGTLPYGREVWLTLRLQHRRRRHLYPRRVSSTSGTSIGSGLRTPPLRMRNSPRRERMRRR